ncbi:hypothetical protein V9T40_007486 [Parthenolecanium corni]|uniref:Uncharacterized protein n=1 Tax=Parthenolecanium corni TaxID=536013 RepID=A0AAN9Y484_9HEMI
MKVALLIDSQVEAIVRCGNRVFKISFHFSPAKLTAGVNDREGKQIEQRKEKKRKERKGKERKRKEKKGKERKRKEKKGKEKKRKEKQMARVKLNNDDDMRTCEENENSVRSRGSRSGAAFLSPIFLHHFGTPRRNKIRRYVGLRVRDEYSSYDVGRRGGQIRVVDRRHGYSVC